MAAKRTDEQKILGLFEDLGFFQRTSTSTGEIVGDCPFCGGSKKFYLRTKTGEWHCKAGSCTTSGGNVVTFMETFVEYTRSLNESGEVEAPWDELSRDRGLPKALIQSFGLVYDGSRWWIPENSHTGRIGDLRKYERGVSGDKKSRPIKGIVGGTAQLWGLDELQPGLKVYLCEGEWDRIALIGMLRQAKRKANVVSVPGAGTFKREWAEALAGYEVVSIYDNGIEGLKGTTRAYRMVRGSNGTKPFKWVKWPDSLPDGFDVRDYYKVPDRTLQGLFEFIEEFTPEEEDSESDTGVNVESFPALSNGNRPTLEETLKVYKANLKMSRDSIWALRVIYAVIIAMQIEGDPLWVHVCSPPGGLKTELLMSCATVGNVITRSTITAHSLVSGWNASQGGKDPSLVPKIIGKIFCLKDYTELLDLPSAERYLINAILRGAYDGKVEKSFGNGVERIYEGHFNMLTGVTPAIFRESGTSLGERFLIIHINQGVAKDHSDAVRAAFDAVSKETRMRAEMAEAAKRFLEYRIEPEDIGEIEFPEEIVTRLIALAQLVAMLRANVERDFTRERVLYRPQHEIATRLVKQFKKLLMGLALQRYPPVVTEEDFAIVERVARDSCIGFNYDTLRQVARYHNMTLDEISERASIPKNTLRDRLEDLVMLGVLQKEYTKKEGGYGRPSVRYQLGERVQQFWIDAGLSIGPVKVGSFPGEGKNGESRIPSSFGGESKTGKRQFSGQNGVYITGGGEVTLTKTGGNSVRNLTKKKLVTGLSQATKNGSTGLSPFLEGDLPVIRRKLVAKKLGT